MKLLNEKQLDKLVDRIWNTYPDGWTGGSKNDLYCELHYQNYEYNRSAPQLFHRLRYKTEKQQIKERNEMLRHERALELLAEDASVDKIFAVINEKD